MPSPVCGRSAVARDIANSSAIANEFAPRGNERGCSTNKSARWEDYYKARPVSAGEDRLEMVAYIHLNRDGHARSVFTSHPDYLGERVQPWLKVERGLRPFGGSDGYRELIGDRERIRAARRRARLLDY